MVGFTYALSCVDTLDSLAVGVLFRSPGDNKEVVSSSNKKGEPDREADTKGR